MRMGFAIGFAGVLSASVALADEVHFPDGRIIVGSVTIQGDTVVVEMPYGTLRFPKADILRIERKDTPEERFAKELAEVDPGDTDALLGMARRADELGLKRQAGELYSRVIKLNPDHTGVRHVLGYAQVDGKWIAFAQAMELSHSKLEAGQIDELLTKAIPELQAAAGSADERAKVGQLRGLCLLRAMKFDEAAEAFARLAKASEGAWVVRFAAMAEILQRNQDGMYILTTRYPPEAALFGGKVLEPGPASLARPLVLEAALRDEAKKHIDAGRKLMAEGKALDEADPDAAMRKYNLALKAFDTADALAPMASRSYRVEITRRWIACARRNAAIDSRKYDDLEARLGGTKLSGAAYSDLLRRMIHHLDNVRENLQRILKLSEPYPRDLLLEITWAKDDLQKVDNRRRVLVKELREE